MAEAFDLEHYKIYDYKKIKKDFSNIFKKKKPIFVEVITDNMQKIFDAFNDR